MSRTIMTILALAALVLATVAGIAAAQSFGTKHYGLDARGDWALDLGARFKKVSVQALGPFTSEGLVAPGATQWLTVSGWDYVGSQWVRTSPATAAGDTMWTVAPGQSVVLETNSARIRLLYFNSGTAEADSLGVLVDWE